MIDRDGKSLRSATMLFGEFSPPDRPLCTALTALWQWRFILPDDRRVWRLGQMVWWLYTKGSFANPLIDEETHV
jgi:hypothetical protein